MGSGPTGAKDNARKLSKEVRSEEKHARMLRKRPYLAQGDNLTAATAESPATGPLPIADMATVEWASDPRLPALLDGDRIVLVDVGSRGGLQKEWEPVAPYLRMIAVEPQAERPADYSGTRCTVDVVPRALGREAGVFPFHETRKGAMCSFLEPDLERYTSYGLMKSAEIVRTIPVETTTLDAVVADQRLEFVDFVKLDTQGSELDVLEGGIDAIGRVAFGLRIETAFVPLYRGQALFADVDAHVRSRGFEFADFIHYERFRRISAPVRTRTADLRLQKCAGQLVGADAVYLRSFADAAAHLETLSGPARRRYLAGALVVCLIYGKFDYWVDLFLRTKRLLDPDTTSLMGELAGRSELTTGDKGVAE